ncbi:hypothetical protein FB446DRAFT_292502 [Lentinula raphanica]|nr:hypothetical protein FB446DRAFT_292502 [Lentinula raphanica]
MCFLLMGMWYNISLCLLWLWWFYLLCRRVFALQQPSQPRTMPSALLPSKMCQLTVYRANTNFMKRRENGFRASLLRDSPAGASKLQAAKRKILASEPHVLRPVHMNNGACSTL